MSDEGMSDAELRELVSRDHTKGCDMRFAACSCGYEGALESAVPALIARLDAAERDRDALRESLREIVTSDSPLGRNGVPSHKEIARRALKGIDHE